MFNQCLNSVQKENSNQSNQNATVKETSKGEEIVTQHEKEIALLQQKNPEERDDDNHEIIIESSTQDHNGDGGNNSQDNSRNIFASNECPNILSQVYTIKQMQICKEEPGVNVSINLIF